MGRSGNRTLSEQLARDLACAALPPNLVVEKLSKSAEF